MRNRIWELDALRGLCLLGMLAVHAVFDAAQLSGDQADAWPGWFSFLMDWGGGLFLLLSGLCATLGHHPLRRGLQVLLCGLLVTAVTALGSLLGLLSPDLTVWFGVLHCLGCCMLLWPLFRRLSSLWLGLAGAAFIALGLWVATRLAGFPWLIPLGLVTPTFASGDFFPLLPNLGFFLSGAVLGRRLYPRRETLFPGVDPRRGPLRPLCFLGRHSLWFYLAHQPVLTGVFLAVQWLRAL